MPVNTPCTPFYDESDEPYFVGQESWEAFVKCETENLCSQAAPAPGVSEMVFEKPERMVEEQDNYTPYDEQLYFRNFVDEFDLSKIRRPGSYKLHMEHDNDLSETQGSDCLNRNPEAEQEEVGSVSTRDSRLGEFYAFDSDRLSMATDSEVFDENGFDLETELTKKVINVLRQRPDEEKAYIEKIFPMLLNSVKEVFAQNQLPLNNQIVAGIVQELLHSKETMMAAEREILNSITEEELEEVSYYERPDAMITEDELAVSNRKEKRAVKGHRNGSSMNHMNENYVSNIFQFAKRNYPEDKELHRIGNERNVSALNFKRLVGTKLTDGIMARRAKARIAESGKELVGNVEYWMRDGYFEQCADREKYIYHKEKALRDLALSGKH